MKMVLFNHELNYRTPYGGWVCTCSQYFDSKEELDEHIKKKKGKL
jgi:hypothetical protein